jgi:hypothetical protein
LASALRAAANISATLILLLSAIFPPCAEMNPMYGILGGRSAGRRQRRTAINAIAAAQAVGWHQRAILCLATGYRRSLPAGQGIVTFFTIFLPSVYCSAPKLSTAVGIFPILTSPSFSTTRGRQVKIKLLVGARARVSRRVQPIRN